MLRQMKALQQQVIVVTGATSGNGLALVEHAVRRGTSVVAGARNEAALEAFETRLTGSGGQIAIRVTLGLLGASAAIAAGVMARRR